MSDDIWEAYALKYGEVAARTRNMNFLGGDDHAAAMPLDFYIWVLRQGGRTILVDTGFDRAEAAARGREVAREPAEAIAALGLTPDAIDEIIVTHLHYDHAGGLHLFPNATLHMQAAEMAYATGPCMCHGVLRMPFTADHVCEAVRRVYSGRVIFHDGDGEIAEGVSVHCIGGHSRGLQCVRVRTQAGWMVLASDASHYYENMMARKPFPIVVDLQNMLDGFARMETLASRPDLIVPGHDPKVCAVFAPGVADHIFRLDPGPIKPITL